MSEPPIRRLAAILHADVVESTSLVRMDETLAHQRIRDAFQRLSGTVSIYGGIAHEIRGDALVAEFRRVSDALSAALLFQRENEIHNRSLDDRLLPVLRSGIALGEVVIADGTVTGEGVVLAQRLEQLAGAGGVCIQGAACETVPKRLPFEYSDIGEHELSGFDAPVRAFLARVEPGSSPPEPEPAAGRGAWIRATSAKPAIAVLPFDNLSGDPEQAYFSDGLSEDIITELCHFRDLFVAARNSAFAFRGPSIDLKEVGSRLKVNYALQGSVRKSGNRIRISAQLIDIDSGGHVWADRFDRVIEDLFAVQDEVVRIIVTTLIGQVERTGEQAARRKQPSSMEAYDCMVCGLGHFYKWTHAENRRARELFEQATLIDPGYAPAYAWLAEAHFREGLNAWSASHEESFSLCHDYAVKAVDLDDTDSRTHTSLGVACLFRGDHDLARASLKRALSLNPGDTRALVHLARCEVLAGNFRTGLELLDEARRFNPLANFDWYAGQIDFVAGKYRDAINTLNRISNPNVLVHAFLAASYALAGDNDSARRCGETFRSDAEQLVRDAGAKVPGSWVDFVLARYPFHRVEDAEHLANGLKEAGVY